MAIVFAATLALAGTALAAPYDPATITVGSGNGTYEIQGTGFGETQPDQYVTATVLSSSGASETYRFSLDANGNFSGSVPGDECAATVTIVGYPSGETRTAQIGGVQCNDPGDNGYNGGGNGNGGTGNGGSNSGGSAGVGGTGYSTGGGSYNGSGYSYSNSGQGAYNAGTANTGTYNAGLANTGASIAAPVAIGLGTLVLGLGLLFFGTRGVIRRKG